MGSSPTPGTPLPQRHPKAIGERSEVEVIAALHRAGYLILTAPFSDNARYDCAIDDGERFWRVQIKTARVTPDGCVRFCTSSNNWWNHSRAPYYGQADLFAAYCPDNGKTYLVPVMECGRREAKLRLTPARNNQVRGVRLAADYELKPVT